MAAGGHIWGEVGLTTSAQAGHLSMFSRINKNLLGRQQDTIQSKDQALREPRLPPSRQTWELSFATH